MARSQREPGRRSVDGDGREVAGSRYPLRRRREAPRVYFVLADAIIIIIIGAVAALSRFWPCLGRFRLNKKVGRDANAVTVNTSAGSYGRCSSQCESTVSGIPDIRRQVLATAKSSTHDLY